MIIGFAVAFVVIQLANQGYGMLDLAVYRVGGGAWLNDIRLYSDTFPKPLVGPTFPFTYPPIAAVIFSPLWLLPMAIGKWVITSISVLCAFVVAWYLTPESKRETSYLAPIATVLVLLVSYPAASTFGFGQVNLLLMALTALCVLKPNFKWGGVLLGIAAAIKLTPLVFLLYLVIARRFRDAVVTFATFVGLLGVGFIVAPKDSAQYWFHTLLDPARIGGTSFASNQSIRGFLARQGLSDNAQSLWWKIGVVLVLAIASIAAARLLQVGREQMAVCMIGLAGLFCSPVSWQHHWVWGTALVGLLLVEAIKPAFYSESYPSQRAVTIALFVLGFLILVTAPALLMPSDHGRELSWSLWQRIVGNDYLLFGAIAMITFAVLPWKKPDELKGSLS
jgi:alpha-1,2-mannosyltransferase